MRLTSRFIWMFAALILGLIFVALFVTWLGETSPVQASAINGDGYRWEENDTLAPPPISYTVNTENDKDDGSCDTAPTGDCSLREAINAANSAVSPVEIRFDIKSCVGVCKITLDLGQLPHITGGDIFINGYSQPGASPASFLTPATILIAIDGKLATINGLNITSGNNRIQGLLIGRCGGAGISIWGASATGNVIVGNYLGASGSTASPNVIGVVLGNNAHNNTIGGDEPEHRNLISGNVCNGVSLGIRLGAVDYTTWDNTVSGNFIGTNASGNAALSNGCAGVYVHSGSYGNTIGGIGEAEGNIIAANQMQGVYLHGTGTNDNTIIGNCIGTDAKCSSDLGNKLHGVDIDGGAQYNTVGGDIPAEGNVISGNGPSGDPVILSSGVRIYGAATMSNTVSGNLIGINASGTISIPNDAFGVYILSGANHNLVGGSTAGERNVISGNHNDGVRIEEANTDFNTISGNYIGLNKNGSAILGNEKNGVSIQSGAQYNTIGGDSTGERNIISGNEEDGVIIINPTTMYNTISGNFIGTDPTGNIDLGNARSGVVASDSPNNIIGGSSTGERNVISGNNLAGIALGYSFTSGIQVLGNYIGTNAAGTAPLGNSGYGMTIQNGAHDNIIGGTLAGEGNLVSGNMCGGIHLFSSGTSSNRLEGNIIGMDRYHSVDIGNGDSGVKLFWDAQGNTIGPGNHIAFNDIGVEVEGTDTFSNTITRNSIFANDNLGIDLVTGGNKDIPAPNIQMLSLSATLFEIYGTSCADCLVEVFESPDNDGEGKRFLGSDTADATGVFYFPISTASWPYLTATATDPISGTSEFSVPFSNTFHSLFLPMVMKNYTP